MTDETRGKWAPSIAGLIAGLVVSVSTLMAGGIYIGALDRRVTHLELEMREMRPILHNIHTAVTRTEQGVMDMNRRLERLEDQ